EGRPVRVGPVLDAPGHRRVRLPGRVRGADDRHHAGVQEDVEVHVAEREWAARHVGADTLAASHDGEDDTAVSRRATPARWLRGTVGAVSPPGVADRDRVVVVGASLAGLRAVEELRRLGYDGEV